MAKRKTGPGQDNRVDDAFRRHLADIRQEPIPDPVLELAEELQDLLRQRENPN